MKRNIILVLITLACTGFLAAQGAAGTAAPETLRGNLAVIDGQIALQSGDIAYYLPGLRRLSGFVDGFKEGAAVVLEGTSYDAASFRYPIPPTVTAASRRVFLVQKMTLNGRVYDNLGRGTPGASMPSNPLMPMPMHRRGGDHYR